MERTSRTARLVLVACLAAVLSVGAVPPAFALTAAKVTVDADSGGIVNETTGKTYQAQPFPPFVKDIIEKGGLIAAVREKVGS